jgi:hypothetical protein
VEKVPEERDSRRARARVDPPISPKERGMVEGVRVISLRSKNALSANLWAKDLITHQIGVG